MGSIIALPLCLLHTLVIPKVEGKPITSQSKIFRQQCTQVEKVTFVVLPAANNSHYLGKVKQIGGILIIHPSNNPSSSMKTTSKVALQGIFSITFSKVARTSKCLILLTDILLEWKKNST